MEGREIADFHIWTSLSFTDFTCAIQAPFLLQVPPLLALTLGECSNTNVASAVKLRISSIKYSSAVCSRHWVQHVIEQLSLELLRTKMNATLRALLWKIATVVRTFQTCWTPSTVQWRADSFHHPAGSGETRGSSDYSMKSAFRRKIELSTISCFRRMQSRASQCCNVFPKRCRRNEV